MPAPVRTVLSNGLVALAESRADSSAVSISLTVNYGSRHEPRALGGATHFVEHLLFKGTDTRDVFALAREMNNQGGRMNAVTTPDFVRLYTDVISGDLAPALELIRDMAFASSFPVPEVDRERTVILEEISEYLDSPEELCFDSFVETLWARQPAGRPVIGTRETVSGFSRADLLAWWQRIRRPTAMVLSIAGGVDTNETLKLSEKIFGSMNGAHGSAPRDPAAANAMPGRIAHERDLEQVQFCVGFGSVARRDDRRFPLALFELVLGGGQGSRLFNEIRERRGLAYTIGASSTLLRREGYLAIHGSTSPDKLAQVLELADKELRKLLRTGPTRDEMETARRQFERSYLMALENNSFRAARNADRELYHLENRTDAEILQRVRSLTAKEVIASSQEVYALREPAVSLVGPVK